MRERQGSLEDQNAGANNFNEKNSRLKKWTELVFEVVLHVYFWI
jgi:hypothetical protein